MTMDMVRAEKLRRPLSSGTGDGGRGHDELSCGSES